MGKQGRKFGTKLSEETKRSISTSLTGRSLSDEHRAKLSVAAKKRVFKTMDLTGQRYGLLLVLYQAPKPNRLKKECTYWMCLCACGTQRVMQSHALRSNGQDNCGCQSRKRQSDRQKKEYGAAGAHVLFVNYTRGARLRKLAFDLTKAEFLALTKQDCYYCGVQPSQISMQKRQNGEYIYNGVDRLDSQQGYSKENCVPCCKRCNLMKMAMSVDAFTKHMIRILTHLKALRPQVSYDAALHNLPPAPKIPPVMLLSEQIYGTTHS